MATKVLISVDEKLLRRVDEKAKREGTSRSAYFAKLAEEDLGQEQGPGADPAVGEAIERLRELFQHVKSCEDSTDAIRRMRDEA